MKYKLTTFGGLTKVVEIVDGATKGATVGVDLFYNGVLVRWEDIYNGGVTPADPSQPGVSAWNLIVGIPGNVSALANHSGTGIYVLTGPGASATREIVSSDASVTITNPDGVAGDIDLSVSASGGGILPVVTGEVYADQPRFVHNPDGTLIYARVE